MARQPRMVTKLFLCLVGLNYLHLFLVRADPHAVYPDALNITDVVEMLESELVLFVYLFLCLLFVGGVVLFLFFCFCFVCVCVCVCVCV